MDLTLLLEWYKKNKRLLPWRIDKNPYHVWISEVMLQQTRIDTVIPYYEKFISKLPNIVSLANVAEDELLKLWEGLGYYSRARNLKKAAQMIKTVYHGIFPNSYAEIIKLPGIGDYTASAIASICFNEKTPTIDGNVLRVYSRLVEDQRNVDLVSTKRQIKNDIQSWMTMDTGEFNEAFMELGETICLPNKEAKCEICPLKSICKAYQNQSWQSFPIKLEKRAKKELNYTVLLFIYKDLLAIRKRKQGLLKNMWEFPNILGAMKVKQVKNFLDTKNIIFSKVCKSISYTHIFTHQIWRMQAYLVFLDKKILDFSWASVSELKKKYAIPKAFQPFLEEIKFTYFDKQ